MTKVSNDPRVTKASTAKAKATAEKEMTLQFAVPDSILGKRTKKSNLTKDSVIENSKSDEISKESPQIFAKV